MQVILWSKYHCPNCDTAKSILKTQGISFEERKIGDGWSKEELLEQVPDARSVPQIIIDDRVIGGLVDLKNYLKEAVNG